MKYLFKVILLSVILFSVEKYSIASVPLIPMPQEVEWSKKDISFSSLQINCPIQFANELEQLHHFLDTEKIPAGEKGDLEIEFKVGRVNNPHGFDGAYKLEVSDKVTITAINPIGIFYGIQTLKQLIQKRKNQFSIPVCEISDWPAFKIRGFMHDLGRNFISIDRLKQQIEIMAAYKYNIFHMHLTDNPGWRLESLIYPELQSEEATARNVGKFYSQEEFKDLINFCQKLHITIIPELDLPGHTLAFRKAMKIKTMNSVKVQNILLELIDELCSLAPAEVMPYIHLGTDEVRQKEEFVDEGYLLPLIRRIESHNRRYISWWHGIATAGDNRSIKQLWADSAPLKGHPFIDSRSNYVNHLDPLAAISQLYFQQPCRAPHGDETRLGGILCSWPDNRVNSEDDIFKQNPIYPTLVAYSEAIWRGVKRSTERNYWVQLPTEDSKEYKDYLEFEERVVAHRDRYFKELEFPFLKNADIPWRYIGPFNHSGDMSKQFEVEHEIKKEYSLDGKTYNWNDTILHGGTVHLKHFLGFPSPVKEKEGTIYALNYLYSPKNQEIGFWIGFHGWSRAGGRRGGPTAEQGQWHTTDPKIWVNDKEIAPPIWAQPGIAEETPELPFVDEDYFYRKPTQIKLNKGWNKFLLKIPHGGNSWKWMFTCIPINIDGNSIEEVDRLRYKTEISKNN